MLNPFSYPPIEFVETMRHMLDDEQVVCLLSEFVAMLQETRTKLDHVPYESVAAVRFLAIKLRGTASEFGASRLAETARTMERALSANPRNAVDWRLLLRAELEDAVQIYNREIARLRAQPAEPVGLKIISSA